MTTVDEATRGNGCGADAFARGRMRHVEIAATVSSRSDIERRLTGRFYTPHVIAERLANATLAAGDVVHTVGDPFCGDGRLVVAWLRAARADAPRALESVRRIVLWDYDEDAVRTATRRVRSMLVELGRMDCVVDARSGDTFTRARVEPRSIDVLLTNPPWELLKPDARDGVGSARAAYTASLRAYARGLAAEYPEASSVKGKAVTGYGVNLARAGALASLRLLSTRGTLGIVLPASIFGDQASEPFRRAVFEGVGADRVEWFPAESKLFSGVDQPFVTVMARAGRCTSALRLVRHRPDLLVEDERIISIDDPAAPLPVSVGGDQAHVVQEIHASHPPLRSLEEDARYSLCLGRELDETRIAEAFARRGGVPFLKGRHVFPWELRRDDPEQRIDPSRRTIPASVHELRIAWRDVSRPTQRRRMHVAVVPRGAVTGNSLGIAYFRSGTPGRIKVLLAILNSFVFELQVRAALATAHVSQGVLRRCAIPESAFADPKTTRRILASAETRLNSGSESAEAEAEVEVARAYGIDRGTFEVILAGFPKVTTEQRAAYLRRELWR